MSPTNESATTGGIASYRRVLAAPGAAEMLAAATVAGFMVGIGMLAERS
jgi:hypothetical protein